LAKRLAKEASKRGFAPTVFDLAQYQPDSLKNEQRLLVITSTYGDGDPPDNAKAFWTFLHGEQAPPLPQLQFSVLALGDSNYAKFCECGKQFDQRFEALGARRVHPRVDCDVDFEAPFQQWLNGALPALSECADASSGVRPSSGAETDAEQKISQRSGALERVEVAAPEDGLAPTEPAYSKTNPFPAPLLTNRKLNAPGSGKDTRHFEISLEGSGLNYEVGDALAVVPVNCAALAEELIRALGCTGEEPVPAGQDQTVPLREALLQRYEITKIPRPFLQAMAERSGDVALKKLATPGVNGELTEFLRGREIIDLLLAFPAVRFAPAEFVGLLKKLPPRLYSISSSPKAHSGQVHLTVAVVRYESLGRPRKGVCSTFLAERVGPKAPVPVFVHRNKAFRPPADPGRPMIMVGPGTGIAPFRAFLEERQAIGATGKSWLFFGDQRERTDFLYRDELAALLKAGALTLLDTAFSRDQEQKVYVQHRMLDHAKELFAWLEEGAHFYVCGDASRMAKDVDQALRQVIQIGGGRTADQAAEYVRALQTQKRYQRDVY
jgi:sulfite reductase (NADPH) flavoprotein alpha-component